MKRIIIFSTLFMSFTMLTFAQKQEEKAVKQVITSFVNAGDQQSVSELEKVLDDAYRVVFNRAFGGDDLQIIDRTAYLSLIEQKKIGGDKRTIDIQSLDINDHIAFVKANLVGKQASFMSYLILAKNAQGEWKMVSDTPRMEVKEN